jgi:SpoVK/Ycf46/Vps4 family AAA+-type ATPase
MFGSFLSWLNDRESDTFVVCTANDVTKLPPEFARAERFDAVYFVDLPSRAEKDSIWAIYRELYEIDAAQKRPDDKDWTGAEIKACCRLSVLLDQNLVDAANNIVPVAVTSAESIGKLRSWASGRCLDATHGGIYGGGKTKRRRAVEAVGPAPSNN